jgi:hypothetical protein
MITSALVLAPAVVGKAPAAQPCWCIPFIRSELERLCGLVRVFRQSAAAFLVENAEIILCGHKSLVRRELVQSCRLAVVVREAAEVLLIQHGEIMLCRGKSLICRELVQARCLAVIF